MNPNPVAAASPSKPPVNRWSRRLATYYISFAVGCFHALLLLLGASLLIQVFLDRRSSLAKPLPVYSKYFHLDSYTFIDRETAIQVGLEFDRMGEQEAYEYHPWTVFMERQFQGKFVTVEEHFNHSTRGTKPPLPLQRGQEDLLVWTFGGSTMFAWGLPDNQTIASHLQDQLQIHLPQYRVRVMNHGHSYWFSSQEMALFIALLRTEERPDIVVFLDGINDTYRMSEGNEATAFWYHAYAGWEWVRRKHYYGDRSWLTFNGAFPLLRLAHYLQSIPPQDKVFSSVPSRFSRPPKDPYTRTLEVYRLNRAMVASMSAHLGIDAYFFWQPTLMYPPPPEVGPGIPQSLGPVYDTLIAEAQAGSIPNFYTLHDALQGVTKGYVDGFHYSDLGSLTIAKRMAEDMVPAWRDRRPLSRRK